MFRPSSRHLRCPSCRSRDLCRCGEVKQLKSETCGDCRDDSAEANGNWKGGRTRHKAGYLMVRAPGHPRATSGPYVFEHILVAEDLLGRYLLDGETVHHRNGVRDDNRPENLELWTNPQPSRIRVSDAVEWARTILERYEGRGAPPTMLTVSHEHPWRWRESNRPGRKGVRRGRVTFTPSERGKLDIRPLPALTATDPNFVSFLCSCVFFVSRETL